MSPATDAGDPKDRGGSRFLTRRIVIQPGRARPYNEGEWRDALVVVEDGRIELDHPANGRWAFSTGDVLVLSGMGLHAIHNPGPRPAVLRTTSRRQRSVEDGKDGEPTNGTDPRVETRLPAQDLDRAPLVRREARTLENGGPET